MEWCSRQDVRMMHCDPAGIVFYPRYFEMLTICTDDWFRDMLGQGPAEMRARRGLGMPTVALSVAFKAASRVDDLLEWRVRPTRIGSASCDLLYCVRCGAELRLEITQTLVLMDMHKRRSHPWPDDLRMRLTGLSGT